MLEATILKVSVSYGLYSEHRLSDIVLSKV